MSRASKTEKLHNFLKDLESQPEEESKQVLKEKLSRLQQDKEALALQVMVNYSKRPVIFSHIVFPANSLIGSSLLGERIYPTGCCPIDRGSEVPTV